MLVSLEGPSMWCELFKECLSFYSYKWRLFSLAKVFKYWSGVLEFSLKLSKGTLEDEVYPETLLCRSPDTQISDSTNHMAEWHRVWNLPIDIHMDLVPLLVFHPDHLIFSFLTTAQLKFVIP